MPSSNRKKVLYVITKSNWGGAQRYVYDLATSLPKDKFDVAVACGDSRKKEGGLPGLLVQRLMKSDTKVILVPSFTRDISIMKEFAAFKELKSLFRTVFQNERPNVVHLNSSKAGGIGALAARFSGIKNIIFTSHGLPWNENRNMLSRTLIFLASYLTFLLCHKVILLSKSDFSRVKNLPFCKRRAVLIQNGIAPINFKSREDARREIIGKPIKDTPWIGTIAEFTRNKGLIYLVAAAALLKKRGLAFRMSLIGDGEDLPKIKKYAVESGLYNSPGSPAYIDLPGFVADYASNLKAFEIFVLSSVKEGLPYVLLEAGQAECAVVGSRIPRIVDVIGEAGILVEPKNPSALTEAIERLLKDPALRRTLGKKLRERVEKEFSLAQMVRETSNLYCSD